tara:strand:+ start:13000 stop:13683 length:684 start_codon:yes stop_codon:yes gene_type:complete
MKKIDKYDKYLKDKHINILKKISEGSVGQAFHVCIKDKCKIILKIQKIKTTKEKLNFLNEIKIQKKVAKLCNYVPKIYDSWIKDKYGFIVMDYLENCCTLEDYLIKNHSNTHIDSVVKQLSNILDDFNKFKIIHGDLHDLNIFVCKDKLYIIDFGRSMAYSSSTDWDKTYKELYQSYNEFESIYLDRLFIADLLILINSKYNNPIKQSTIKDIIINDIQQFISFYVG